MTGCRQVCQVVGPRILGQTEKCPRDFDGSRPDSFNGMRRCIGRPIVAEPHETACPPRRTVYVYAVITYAPSQSAAVQYGLERFRYKQDEYSVAVDLTLPHGDRQVPLSQFVDPVTEPLRVESCTNAGAVVCDAHYQR